MDEDKILLRDEDLRAIAELLENCYDNPKIRKRYSYILTVMADSMLSDDAIVVTENYFRRVWEIVEKICSSYCKYPDIWDEEKEGMQLMDSDICMNCPLNDLFL